MIDFVALENQRSFTAAHLALGPAVEAVADKVKATAEPRAGRTSASRPAQLGPVTFTGYCADCGALLVITRKSGKSYIDPVDGGYCHGDAFCAECLTYTVTNDRVCRGCRA